MNIFKQIIMIPKIFRFHLGRKSWISPSSKIIGKIVFENNIIIHSRCLLEEINDGLFLLKDGVEINTDSRFLCSCKIEIGSDVLIGPNVYIADGGHEYSDISRPIKEQRIKAKGGLTIGDNCWIGKGACIISSISIGKGCVIGANSVVTKNVPDFCVVCGNPAKIVKKYSCLNKQWIAVPHTVENTSIDKQINLAEA